MGFSERIAGATQFEHEVVESLESQGWTAGVFGQALLPEPVKNRLREHKTAVRWLPDIIAFRDKHAIFVDAKNSPPHHKTGNHAVESASTETQLAWGNFSGMPVMYAFPHDNGRIGYMTAGSWSVMATQMPCRTYNGSGTPFHVCQCHCVFDLDYVVGDPE